MRRYVRTAILIACAASTAFAAEVRIRVVDPLDEPVVGVSMRIVAVPDDGAEPRPVTPFLLRTNRLGEVALREIKPGRYRARMHLRPRRRPAMSAVREFEVVAGATLQALTLELGLDPGPGATTPYRIDGRLIGARRQVGALYWVLFRRAGADDGRSKAVLTGANGRFAVPAIEAGRYQVFCRVSDAALWNVYSEYFLNEIDVDDDIPDLTLSWFERVR